MSYMRRIYLHDEIHSVDFLDQFQVGDVLEVVKVEKDAYTLTVKRVYTTPKPVTSDPPDLGVSVGEKVGTKERLG